ncbi:MAG: dihydrolipoamide acetyltransferase family protein [Vicinamibacterales bacterium]
MSTPVLMPQMGESIAEGTLVRWLKKVGDSVDRDEPLFEISTDKVDAEIPSPTGGVLLAIHVKEGEMAAVNGVVAVIGQAGESVGDLTAVVAAVAPAAAVAASTAPVARAASSGGRRTTSPLVRRLAREHQLDVSTLAGSGLDGRVTKTDFMRALAGGASAKPALPGVGPNDRVETLSTMRRKIAEHMVLSQRTSAHAHSVFHVDFSHIAELRAAKKGEYEKAGVKLTFMAFIARVVLDGLKNHPVLNASLDANNVIYRRDVHLGVAVSLDNGLIVPVIPNAETKSTKELAVAIADVANRARSKKLAPTEVAGGTFTITNPGQYGAQFGFPIINQPQVGILCIGTVEKRAVVVNDALAVRLMSYLTLGFDHRLVDGAVADAFMAEVKHGIEHFDAAAL